MNQKTIFGIVITCIVIVIIGGVYLAFSNSSGENWTLDSQTPNQVDGSAKSIVIYFSVPETDSPNNMTQDEENSTVVVDGEVLGNTEYVARLIREKTESDIFRLEPADAYPTNHDQLLRRAQEEMQNDERPALKEDIDISSYDTIYIGYPIWNADLPPIIHTFLESHDFDGKTIVPFCTHGGSGLSGTTNTLAELLDGATVIRNGFELYRSNMEDAPDAVDTWLSEIGSI